MSIDERARHELYLAFEEALGAERADHLMDLLPPVGWADVATKTDLGGLEKRLDLRFGAVEQRMDLRFDAVDLRFAAFEERIDQRFEKVDLRFEAQDHRFDAKLEHEIRELTRTLMLGLVAAMATMTSLCLAAITLTR
jgi:hypothetical protein